jgi:hypothetical protein
MEENQTLRGQVAALKEKLSTVFKEKLELERLLRERG